MSAQRAKEVRGIAAYYGDVRHALAVAAFNARYGVIASRESQWAIALACREELIRVARNGDLRRECDYYGVTL